MVRCNSHSFIEIFLPVISVKLDNPRVIAKIQPSVCIRILVNRMNETIVRSLILFFIFHRQLRSQTLKLAFQFIFSFCFQYLKNKSTTFRGGRSRQRMISHALWLIGLSGNALVVIMGSSLAYMLTKDNVSPFILTGERCHFGIDYDLTRLANETYPYFKFFR